MDFDAILAQVRQLLQRQGRVSYRALKLRFQLDDEALAALTDELIYAERVARDEDKRVLVWVAETGAAMDPNGPFSRPLAPDTARVGPHAPEAERRQLTVLFCDLVDSTVLASRLDPEDWREVVRAYQDTCAVVIARYEGHIAQYLGDGLLVYFGYPQAHEDDAQRAVRAGLGMVDGIGLLNTRLEQDHGVRLAIRVGIHTGLVVVGDMGSGDKREALALGDTPNIAARLQGLAAPDTVVISPATHRLVQGYFTVAALGSQSLKGIAAPVPVYRILSASAAQSRLDVVEATGWTPLVGRESEAALLLERWSQSQAGQGQVVLLSGEPGIGKTRLVEVLRQQVIGEGSPCIVLRCSPYHTYSALYPVIEHLQRWLQFTRDDTPEEKLRKLEEAVARTGEQVASPSIVSLVAALLSVPLPEGCYPVMPLSPQQQRQRTLDVLVAWLLAEAERQPVLAVWEDLHWADPSTLELLGLVIDQARTARMLTLVTYRPEFRPPWSPRFHLTQVTLGRLSPPQVETMVRQLTEGKSLPAGVLAQVVAKTDGVPLFVEELVKMLLESGLVREEGNRYGLAGPLPPLAIPTTLQDSLMARLDRLSRARAVAQLGAVLGREFPYEFVRAVAPLDEDTVQRGLAELVDAELLYQRGRPPHARYAFKHALIQETAYQSLLKSTRQQAHRQIAQVLEAQFPETSETQPELVAHHYTEAGLTEQAIPYWQGAGQHALERSANVEAISHFTTGIELLKTLPETPARLQHALTLYIALGAALLMSKGHAAPEVEDAYTQARALCQQVGETPQLAQVLFGLWRFYIARPQLHTAREIGETLLRLAQQAHDPSLSVIARYALGTTWFWLGSFPAARQHLEEGIARYTPDQRHAIVFRIGQDPRVACRAYGAMILWLLGYPARALARLHDALTWAHELSHPFSLAWAWSWAAIVSQVHRDVAAVLKHADAAVTLSTEQGFPFWAASGMIYRGWALVMQGQGEEGLVQARQGLAAYRATGAALFIPYLCTWIAEVYDHLGRTEDGLQVLAEAHPLMEQHEDRWWEAEVCRLRGVLLLRQPGTPQAEAEPWLQRALDVARRQEAKSLELRAAMSLARLWQQQGRQAEAHALLAPIYGWFTEGFDTADLQEAKALLAELS